MDKQTILNIVNTRGVSYLTQAQKDLYYNDFKPVAPDPKRIPTVLPGQTIYSSGQGNDTTYRQVAETPSPVVGGTPTAGTINNYNQYNQVPTAPASSSYPAYTPYDGGRHSITVYGPNGQTANVWGPDKDVALASLGAGWQETPPGYVSPSSKANLYAPDPNILKELSIMMSDPDFVSAYGGTSKGNFIRNGDKITNVLTGKTYSIRDTTIAAATDAAGAIVDSGHTLNPNLTPEDLALVDYTSFLEQAGKLVSPYYAQRFNLAKQTIETGLGRLNEDLTKKQGEIERTSEETKRTGQETLADRGLTFSGQRGRFDTQLRDQTSRQQEDALTTAQRSGQDLLNKGLEAYGSSTLSGLGNTSIGGRSLNFGSTPVIGSEEYQRTTDTNALARSLAADENTRRQYAYNLSTRSF